MSGPGAAPGIAPELAEAGWKPLRSGPFADRVGPILRRRGEGGARRYALATDAGHGNVVGLVHGGAAATLLDQAMAVEAWEEAGRRPVVTMQMELRWLSPLRPGALLEAEARVLRRAGAMLFMEATVRVQGRAEGRAGEDICVAASAIMKITRDRTGEREETT